jgi:FkbM family methyltransferase
MAAVDYVSTGQLEHVPPARGALGSSAVHALFRLAWPFTWPVRWYWSHSERQVGKKLLVDRVLKHFLPAGSAEFEAELAGGGRVLLRHRDDIGVVVLLAGAFEPAETACARELASEGSVAIDVGANVGMFTVPMAIAVGSSGRVLAVEPCSENVLRLVRNLELNELDNVEVHGVALAEEEGEVLLQLGADPAFHSTATVDRARATGDCTVVRAQTLDRIWHEAGSPDVCFLKVDTEGGELDVLRGGSALLRAFRPSILLEAKSAERLDELDSYLLPFGYARTRRRGFAVGNYLYCCAQ